MNNLDAEEKLSKATVQISRLVWLAALDKTSPTDSFIQLIFDLENDDVASIFGINPEYFEDVEPDNFLDYLFGQGKLGFLAELKIPVKHHFDKDGGGCRYNFGNCYYIVIYADSLDELISKAIETAQNYKISDRKKEL